MSPKTPEPDQRNPELSPNKGSWRHPGQGSVGHRADPLCLQTVAMELVPSDMERGLQTPVWTSYQPILSRAGCAVSLRPPPRKGSGILCASLGSREK